MPQQCKGHANLHRPRADYGQSVVKDFEMIEPHLPAKVASILDIGCGLAGIDVLLKQKYPDAKLSLLDSDGKHSNSGFTGGAGGNRQAAEELLAANGVKPDAWLDIGTKELLEADLVISLLSWGFHYPLSTYKVKGLCVADLRRGHEKPRGTVIWKASKSDRCLWSA